MMSSKILDGAAQPRKRGRPTVFDADEAIEAAMRVFWEEGYEAASVDRLCEVTRMPRASLYRLYGGKEGLFLSAIRHYVETRVARLIAALGPSGSLTEDIERFFCEVVALASGQHGPNGCLISCVLTDAAGANPRFRQELESRFSALEARIAERLRAADLPEDPGRPPEVQAMLVAAVARGIMVRARSGAAAEQLLPVARAAASLCLPGRQDVPETPL